MVFGLLLAAGSSTRFGEKNKLLERLPDGSRVIDSSFRALADHHRIEKVGVVGSHEILRQLEGKPMEFSINGGSTRRESCLLGLERVPPGALVLVHDAARPFASAQLIDRVIDAATQHGAAIPVVPVTDTIKRVENDIVVETPDRIALFRAQTPQAALRETLIEALMASANATDEASALEALGIPVHVVPGEETNVKITTMSDLPPRSPISVVGTGFDIHAFSRDTSRKLMLGGVHFEGERGLEGHSDADVILHALTDAILGAFGGGDIGMLFPNTDAAYAGADSLLFLRRATEVLTQAGGRVFSVDITVLAEQPKLGSRREQIRQRISQELSVPQRRVNVKATTMEGLGAIGRNEGIAAMASVTVLLNEKYEE
jgi:2-C-methyl-D-erythritol 4-phosphate cytidylyltransferase/2-C-methyl-D-erythritol 2,4-cyclodiphosphate synthase